MHIECCKGAYIEMEAAADHVPHEVAGRYTCAKCLIVSVDGYKDPGIQAVISTINNCTNNLHVNWTSACLLLLPACPIAKWMSKKWNNAQISGIGAGILCKASEDQFRLLSSPNSRYMFHVLARSLSDMLRSRCSVLTLRCVRTLSKSWWPHDY